MRGAPAREQAHEAAALAASPVAQVKSLDTSEDALLLTKDDPRGE